MVVALLVVAEAVAVVVVLVNVAAARSQGSPPMLISSVRTTTRGRRDRFSALGLRPRELCRLQGWGIGGHSQAQPLFPTTKACHLTRTSAAVASD